MMKYVELFECYYIVWLQGLLRSKYMPSPAELCQMKVGYCSLYTSNSVC